MEIQVAQLLALQEAIVDKIPLEQMAAFAARLPEWLAAHAPDVIAKLEHSGEMDAASRAALKNAIQSLANEFTAGQEEGNVQTGLPV
jgi:F0F1-type ATP synthase alpha subunit